MQVPLARLQLLGQLVHLFDESGMLVCLELEVAFIGLKFAPFLLEQAVALFKSLHHVALAPLGLVQTGFIALQLIFDLLQLLAFFFQPLIELTRCGHAV